MSEHPTPLKTSRGKSRFDLVAQWVPVSNPSSEKLAPFRFAAASDVARFRGSVKTNVLM